MPQIHPENPNFTKRSIRILPFVSKTINQHQDNIAAPLFGWKTPKIKKISTISFSARGLGKRESQKGSGMRNFGGIFLSKFLHFPAFETFCDEENPISALTRNGGFFLLKLLGRIKFLPKGRTFNGIMAKIPNPEEQEVGMALFPQSHTTLQVSRHFSNHFSILK